MKRPGQPGDTRSYACCNIMLKSLIYDGYVWAFLLRRRLARAESLGFLAMLGLPLTVIGLIVYFAYSQQTRVDVARLELERQRTLELRCLAENIYFEARGEPLKGQYAVAEVTLNRMVSPFFPDSECDVVHEKRWDPLRKRFV